MINWNTVPGKVITVISDLHSNKLAVAAALKAVNQKRNDQLIILGDILTYGIDAQEVTDMVSKAIDNGAWLLMGNHDEMYLQLITGHCPMYNKLRPDLQESISYNLVRLDAEQFSSWPWQKQIIHDNIYFSHANPYGNVWDYVKDVYDFREATKKIKRMGHFAGVFGHTHRSKCFSLTSGNLSEIDGLTDDIFVLNPGSIGQPRIKPLQTTLLRLSSHENKLWAEVESIQYDMAEHVNNLIASSLSDLTKRALIAHFTE